MSHSTTSAAQLLVDNLALLTELEIQSGILDLACGKGRNSLPLLEHNLPVIFADRDGQALAAVAEQVSHLSGDQQKLAEYWQVDFEEADTTPLAGKQFDAVLVFNYLHRPVLPAIREVIRPGGLIVYETFTVDQPDYGRPTNPDFLLAPGELEACFAGWHVIRSFSGTMPTPTRAVANLIARRPRQK